MKKKTLKVIQEHAMETVGGLSFVTKMPGSSWSISAKKCNVGAKLAEIPGTVCHKCYALRGHYARPTVKNALQRRLDRWHDNPRWAADMAQAITDYADKKGVYYHRWFDSGDLQSLGMLLDLVLVAKLAPRVQHWLPTKEYGIVRKFARLVADGTVIMPPNLTIRVSHPNVDGRFKGDLFAGFPTSVVSSGDAPKGVFSCPAPQQNNECGDCRACWNPKLKTAAYHKH